MSSSSLSPQPVQLEQIHESDVVCEVSLSLNQETLNQLDPPPPKFDPGNTPPPQPVIDPEDNSLDEEEDDNEDGGEIDEGQEQETPAISSGMAALHVDPPIVSVPEVTIASPPNGPNTRWRAGKRKKGKGKPNIKKQQAIEEKLQTLMAKLNPIPFIPNKILDFAKHEKLLKKLGLWDFVHIDFDRNIRVDLIAQLIATYEAKPRASHVNEYRIMVSRADLARAFKLPCKKKGNAGGEEVDLEQESLSDDSIGFITDFVSDWVLLHEDDAWMMPNEVSYWFKVIKDGHPEKVDWASLFWFMVEKELRQGGGLRDCYYASHLQHLMRFQRKEFFGTVKLDDGDAKEEDHEVKEDCLMEGPSTELTLGQDGEKEEGIKDVEMMDVEKCEDSDDDKEEEEREEEEQGQWFLHGKNELGQHFMQRCSTENAEEFKICEGKKEEEEEIEEEGEDGDEDGNKFHVFPSDDALEGDGFTGNLLQAMEANQMDMRVDMPHISSAPSFFNNAGKRVMEHDDNHILHHDSNKKLRINDTWDHNKYVDFGMCMEQIQHVTEKARMLYEEKEQALEQSNMNQHIMLTELQKRDAVIDHLHKTKLEEIQKKDGEIYRLERELDLMGGVLEGYRKALKETQRAFAEYKEKSQLPEEPTYKDAGLGGLMLTGAEIEKLRVKREEEYKMCRLIVEQKMKEFEEDWFGRFSEFVDDKFDIFDRRLTGLEDDAKGLIELCKKGKAKQTEEDVPEVVEPKTDEKVPEAEEEYVSIPQTEEKMSGVEENQPNA